MSFIGQKGDIVPDVYTWRRWLLANMAQEFSQRFKLRLMTFLTVTRGFNLYEFRYRLGVAEGAWADVIGEKFGKEGVALIELLTGHPQKIASDGATVIRTAPRTKTQQPEVLGTVPSRVFVPPTPRQPQTALGAMFADEPEEVAHEEAVEEEAPPATGSIASLFS